MSQRGEREGEGDREKKFRRQAAATVRSRLRPFSLARHHIHRRMHLRVILLRSRFQSQRVAEVAFGRFAQKKKGDRARKAEIDGRSAVFFCQPLACFFAYVTRFSFASLSLLPSYSSFFFFFASLSFQKNRTCSSSPAAVSE